MNQNNDVINGHPKMTIVEEIAIPVLTAIKDFL